MEHLNNTATAAANVNTNIWLDTLCGTNMDTTCKSTIWEDSGAATNITLNATDPTDSTILVTGTTDGSGGTWVPNQWGTGTTYVPYTPSGPTYIPTTAPVTPPWVVIEPATPSPNPLIDEAYIKRLADLVADALGLSKQEKLEAKPQEEKPTEEPPQSEDDDIIDTERFRRMR